MDFEVYCDESGPEALIKKDAHSFAAIGGIWLPSEKREHFKASLKSIKTKHKVFGELKWSKLSPKYFDLYREVIDLFYQSDYLRFRVVLVEASKVDNIKFNTSDAELGFYKFYYQLLHHWIFDFNNYEIFVDHKSNRSSARLKELKKILKNSNLTSDIKQVQGLHSEQSLGIQLADVLTGLVSTKFNKEATSRAKLGLIEYLEGKYLNRPLSPTSKWEEKLNVFKINLKGGW